jgi:hypothetical protein
LGFALLVVCSSSICKWPSAANSGPFHTIPDGYYPQDYKQNIEGKFVPRTVRDYTVMELVTTKPKWDRFFTIPYTVWDELEEDAHSKDIEDAPN